MATMKASRHEILKEQWRGMIKQYNESGLTVKEWCAENSVKPSQYYYWLRVIRQDTLIQAGTLAVTGQTQFAEVKRVKEKPISNHHDTCAIFRSNGNEIEIINGADPNTLELILNFIGK